MNFVINTRTLYQRLALFESVILKNPAIPIVGNYLFKITEGKLYATVTDLQTSCVTSLPVEAKEEGMLAIPARLLIQTLRNLPEEPATFHFDQERYQAKIKTSQGEYVMSAENPNAFPALPVVENPFEVDIPTKLLRNAISYTSYAMSSDEIRPSMNGLYLRTMPHGIEFVGTDGNRLVVSKSGAVKQTPSHHMIIPRKSIHLMEKIMAEDKSETVKLSFNPTQACFEFDQVKLTCRLIDERYPDYGRVIPQNNDNHLVIAREKILAVLRRIDPYTSKSTRQLVMDLRGEQLEILAKDQEFSNQARESLSCKHTGADIRIGFDRQYLQDAISHLETEDVRIELSDPEKAALLFNHPPGASDEEIVASRENLALIMPITLGENTPQPQ